MESIIYTGFYNYLQKRISRLVFKKDTIMDDMKSKEEYIVIAIDSTGIKVTNSGQWIRDKWHIKNKERYLKIPVAVNVNTKKIFTKVVTEEHVHDSKALPLLVDDVIESDSMIADAITIGKLLTDRVYGSKNIFRYLGDIGILSCIKVRKNSKVRLKTGYIIRNLSVLSQKRFTRMER